MGWLGLDIGGANIKIADGKGYSLSQAFPLWRHPDKLANELQQLITVAPQHHALAVTMTGELADCFATKSKGVEAILDAVETAANGKPVQVYLCDGRIVEPAVARREPLLAAASNWHVLATFATRYLSSGESGLLIDIGSTTTDLIPINSSSAYASGRTDPERLSHGELVYTGVERSPVCAVVSQLPWQGAYCPVAQELFATTIDAYLLLGEIPEAAGDCNTADGRGRTKEYAHARMAHAICADTTMYSPSDAMQGAKAIREAQLSLLQGALNQVQKATNGSPSTIVLSGQGEFLAQSLLRRMELSARVVSLGVELGQEISRAACAHALAVLASERENT